ncbi:MAG: phosphoenolpyruvate--protein phosphotransferase [Oscillospiraceae bacterium]|nr:phosphoenolpyruvate--protein phosphotransferase [Oscillospiraceae bacterium]
MTILQGNPVSPGIAIGRIYKYIPFDPSVAETFCAPEETEAQVAAYQTAKASARAELDTLFAHMSKENPEKAGIFQAHTDILDDEVMDEEILAGIQSAYMAADYAVATVFGTYIDMFSQMEDPLFKERAMDLQDVQSRFIRNLHGIEERNLSSLSEATIVLAEDLFPSDTATIDRQHVMGIVTELGGSTSHSAIIAKGYGIAAVLGIEGLMETVPDGVQAVLDATTGALMIAPDAETLAEYEQKRETFLKEREYTQKFIGVEAITKDGVKIDVGMNIGSVKLPEHQEHAEFIGLFRTEFLYMESDHMPTENEQFEAYKSILLAMGDRPVTLRTLDIGGDKKLDYWPMPHEENPFLGNRALRLCFAREDVFTTQLRAALRASVHGNLQIMFPMVGSLEDFRRGKAAVEAVQVELDQAGIPYAPNVKIGMMVEIPSVALFADKFAAEVDFASIGTNDLTQYLFAVDRMNPQVVEYYQEFSPIMIRTLAQIITAFNQAGKPISICGELGGNAKATAILVGLGLTKLSMNTASFAACRRVITGIEASKAKDLAEQVMAADTEAEVKQLAEAFIAHI